MIIVDVMRMTIGMGLVDMWINVWNPLHEDADILTTTNNTITLELEDQRISLIEFDWLSSTLLMMLMMFLLLCSIVSINMVW